MKGQGISRRDFLKGAAASALVTMVSAGSPAVISHAAEGDGAAEKQEAAGIIRGKVTDTNSNMAVAGVIVTDAQGATVREATNAFGGYELKLAPGVYTLTFTKGFEYETVTREVEVASLKTLYLPDVRLGRLTDSYAKGWLAGDTHQHTYYSDGVDSVHSLMVNNASEGLYWGFLSDHNNSRGVPEWVSALSVNVSTDETGKLRPFVGMDGVEVTTEYGHYNSLGSGLTLETYDLNLEESERSSKEKMTYVRENIRYVLDSIKRVGGVVQMNHPYSTTTMGAMHWIDPADYEVLDMVETVEIWNGYFLPPDGIYTTSNAMNQNYDAKILWYGLLNAMKEGHPFHAATGGSDNHDSRSEQKKPMRREEVTDMTDYYNYISNCGKYAGLPTTYVNLGSQELTMDAVKQALLQGNSFVTYGPVVICDIDGVSYGQKLMNPAKDLTINTDIFNRDGITEIRVVSGGEIIETISLDGTVTTYTDPITISGDWQTHDWILVEVLGPLGQYAITNPILIG